MSDKAYYQLSARQALEHLDTSETGLSTAEAQKRLERDGKNELVAIKKMPPLLKFLLQFRDVLMILLLVAAGMSFLIQNYRDGIVMLLITLINAIIGFAPLTLSDWGTILTAAAAVFLGAHEHEVVKILKRRARGSVVA